jgi:HEAT repeat protein
MSERQQLKHWLRIIPLVAALEDYSYKDVRKAAARALGEIGSPEAISALISALQNSYYAVRQSATEILREIGTPDALLALISVLPLLLDSYHTKVSGQDLINTLEKLGTLAVLENLLQLPETAIYQDKIFLLIRSLMLRHHKAKVWFIPVYPEVVERMRKKYNRE